MSLTALYKKGLSLVRPRHTSAQKQLEWPIAGGSIPLLVKQSTRTRRLTVTVHTASGSLRLSLPMRTPLKVGLQFLKDRQSWIESIVAQWPQTQPLEAGGLLMVEGLARKIDWRPDYPRTVVLEHGSIRVGGPKERIGPRVLSFLREYALAHLREESQALAKAHGLALGRVSVGDPLSRWGSCSAQGNIRYSWRLILAPPWVRSYVVAHEVAHLRHGDHSAKFWALTEMLYEGDVSAAQEWLKTNGALLHRAGR